VTHAPVKTLVARRLALKYFDLVVDLFPPQLMALHLIAS
jgi:hypothetical protein